MDKLTPACKQVVEESYSIYNLIIRITGSVVQSHEAIALISSLQPK